MLASVLIPTRGRIDLLQSSIESIISNVSNPQDIEILLYIDDDEVIDKYNEILSDKRCSIRHFIGPRYFYIGLYKYYNYLSQQSNGQWCLIWNDDSLMLTNKWDEELRKINFPSTNPKGIAVACTESNHGRSPVTFPIISKSMIDVIGHVSLNCHVDTWIEEVSFLCGIHIPVQIKIIRRPAVSQGENTEGSHDYYSKENEVLRHIDVEKIRQYINKE